MIKTYILTTPARNSSVVLRGKTGNSLRYDFKGGDPMTGKAASIILHSKYSQDLLEESDMFKKGFVKLAGSTEGGEVVDMTPAKPVETTQNVDNNEQEKTAIVREDITSAEQLLEFVATELEKPYQRSDAALEYAKKQGYEFPNLDIKK
jgi:hypothetical protein